MDTCQVDFFRGYEAVRDEAPMLGWYRAQPGASPLPAEGSSLTMDEATRPSDRELQANSRSRSAVLHVLRKSKLPRLAELEARAYALLDWSAADPRAGPAALGHAAGVAERSKAEKKAEKKAAKRAAAAAAEAEATADVDVEDAPRRRKKKK